MLEVFTQFRTKCKLIILVFLISICGFALIIFSAPDAHNYQSVYEVGYRDLNAPIERADLIIERLNLVALPKLMVEYADVNVSVFNLHGSSLIRLSTKASVEDGEAVRLVHQQVLEGLLANHTASYLKLEKTYTSQRNALVKLLKVTSDTLTDARRIEHERSLVWLDRQIAHLKPSKIHFVAKPVSGRFALSKGSQLSAAIVFSLLLSLLAGGVALFIQALRSRLA